VPVKGVEASSILNNDEDSYGPHHMLDLSPDTCWNSEGAPHHTLLFTFPQAASVSRIELTFQGGFAGRGMRVGCGDLDSDEDALFEPDDVNESQLFILPSPLTTVPSIRVSFQGSSDFYGRLVIYSARFLK